MEKGYTTELLLKRNKNNENCDGNSLIQKEGEEKWQ